MSDLINPNVNEQKMEALAGLVASYIKAHPEFRNTVAPEIHRGAFDLALKLASAYPSTRSGGDNTAQAIQLAIELLERAYKLISQENSHQPFVWSSDDYSSLS